MAEKKYHISPETGRPNQCTATVRGCKYAVDGEIPEHYDSKEDARKGYEKTMAAEKTGQTTSVSKKSAKSVEADERPSHFSVKVEGFPDFDAETAEPTNFDKVYSEISNRKAEADFNRNRSYNWIQSKFNSKKYNPQTRKNEYTEDPSKVLAEALQRTDLYSSEQKIVDDWKKYEREDNKNAVLKSKLERAFRKRGGWNRAYLVPDGHLHKSMDCSTCNKGEAPTQFQFMTDHSGKSENEIVGEAGYRACTTCYPSAPIGDANSLPSTMLTDDEKKRKQERDEQKQKLAQKKVDAVSKAPTASGQPLTARIGRYKETFKTERSASQWYVAGIADGPPRNEADAENLKNVRYKVLYNLALKHDKPLNEMKEEFDKKAEAKSKRDYKESEKHFKMLGALNADSPGSFQLREYETPEVDKYDVPDELMNKSPREWENANQYIPED